MPKVSVIMPVYNTAQFLPQCIESILSQTFPDFELICVNDGSTDNSADVLAAYVNQDKRVKVITQQNQGLSIARNSGLSNAASDFIAFADSDDYYAPNFLELLVKAQQEYNADIAGCDFQKIRNAEDVLKPVDKATPKFYPDALKVLLHKNNFIHFNVWNKLYKRDVIGDMQFVPHIYYEDWVFNCCMFEKAANFVWIKEKLYAYRYSDNSIMRSSFNEKKLQDYVKGIQEVNAYFIKNAPEKWEQVRKTRISRTIKMMMNRALRSDNKELISQTAEMLQQLYQQKVITYSGLSLTNKVKLYVFLSRGI